ncbi:2-hydroxymethylglutarate dehydrogenase /3-hydroxyisobutyrate dehydrogenase [Thermanaeromonas toyohensis ToBE]|uniref:3-hydroxyisobutyrate dehydrogenase n=1 Tax=Thermanaeromonas toyohensis ToBE TaxID=698762 RepID=A0A1W1VJ79_9FIRM|nr:2-hydroxymethylglutarate dehydrogenase /3-hydroxyisobutyrate dehydrogenase [Thermanaeromonas toyohensis ToBE]
MRVGFIGLGNMGRPMAKNILQKGFPLIVYDIVPTAMSHLIDQGAQGASSPKELAGRVDIVITMLPDAKAVSSVLEGEEGVFAGARKGLLIVDMSTVAPSDTQRLAQEAMARGLRYLDAPVSGGVAGAEAGKLTIMVGGKEEDYKQCLPLFQCMGERIYHVGDIGSGNAVKLVNNLLLGINMIGVAEALTLGVKAGLKPEVLLEVIKNSSGQSYAFTSKVPSFILSGHFKPGFSINLQHKDIELALQTAKECNIPLLLGSVAYQVYTLARGKGWGQEDISAVIKLWEEVAGLEVRYAELRKDG